MNGKIQTNNGDISIIAVKLDDKDVTEIPQKEQDVRFDYADCGNEAEGYWDSTTWEFRIRKLTKVKTKCTLYFKTGQILNEGVSIVSKMQELLNLNEYRDEIIEEQNGNDYNIRFVGSNPNNYVKFNDEKWRIIGLMGNIESADGKTEKLLKIIRNDSLGKYSWDSSELNSNWGVNEWSQSAIATVLNDDYFNAQTVKSHKCYDSFSSVKTCPNWETIGIKADARMMVQEVKWNTGTMDKPFDNNLDLITPIYMYSAERSNHNGKEQCLNSSNICTDTIERQTTWLGNVALIYLSDYGLATTGGQLKKRKDCLELSMYEWNVNESCQDNDWLYNAATQWTMTSAPSSNSASNVFYYSGRADYNGAPYSWNIRPVVYLKSSVKITGGEGTYNEPYILSLN